MWQDVRFAGGLYTTLSPSAAPEGTLAEASNVDVAKGDLRVRAGVRLIGTPAGLAVSPQVKAVGWGQFAGTQELIYAVTDSSGGITVYKWSPGDTDPVAVSPSLDIGATVVISHGAFQNHIYVAVSKGGRITWYRREIGTLPPNPEAFKKIQGASSVSPPGSIATAWASHPQYKPFGAAGDGSSVAYTPTGTSPTSVTLFSTYVKAVYPTNAEPGSTLEVTVTLGATKQFLIDFADAMYMQFLYRNCTVETLYMELETSGGATWRGYPWGTSGQAGHKAAHSWVIFPLQDERRQDRDTEKVVKVRFKFALQNVNSAQTPEIWIDSPQLGGTYLWFDPALAVRDQPLKYAAQYIDNNGDVTRLSAITVVSPPEPPDIRASIGGHLVLTPQASSDPLMSAGQIAVWRALRFDSNRIERWFKMATIANNPGSPGSVTDKFLPREHRRNPEGGMDITTLPATGTVRAIAPHKERLFIGVDNLIWVSAMGNPEQHVVDVGFDPLAPTAPERHYAAPDQSAHVTSFASGDALLVTTDKGAFMEFGWPDQLSYRRVKVFDDPCDAAIEAMGTAIFTSPVGVYGAAPDGAVTEITQNIRGDYSSYRVAWHRSEVYAVSGTSLFHLARTGAWQAGTLGVATHTLYGGFANLSYVLAIGEDGRLYALDRTMTTDNGNAITWRVVTNMTKVPEHVPVEVRLSSQGTPPTVKLIVPNRGEVNVAIYGQAGFTTQDFSGLGLQIVIEGASDTVVDTFQVRWEPEGDRPMQP